MESSINQQYLNSKFGWLWLKHRLAEERSEDFEYQFSASVLEIYNEHIFDLLAGGKEQDRDKLDVKQVCGFAFMGVYLSMIRMTTSTSLTC